MSFDHKQPFAATRALQIATPEEAAAIIKLRTQSGWWNGDARALEVLREFAATIRAQAMHKAA